MVDQGSDNSLTFQNTQSFFTESDSDYADNSLTFTEAQSLNVNIPGRLHFLVEDLPSSAEERVTQNSETQVKPSVTATVLSSEKFYNTDSAPLFNTQDVDLEETQAPSKYWSHSPPAVPMPGTSVINVATNLPFHVSPQVSSTSSEHSESQSIIQKRRKSKFSKTVKKFRKVSSTSTVASQTVCSGDFIINSVGILACELVEGNGLNKSAQTICTGTIVSFSNNLFIE